MQAFPKVYPDNQNTKIKLGALNVLNIWMFDVLDCIHLFFFYVH